MVRCLNILGLTLNALGALLLIFYPPGSSGWSADGAVTSSFRGRWRRGAYVALVAMLLGFVLQLIAAILTQ